MLRAVQGFEKISSFFGAHPADNVVPFTLEPQTAHSVQIDLLISLGLADTVVCNFPNGLGPLHVTPDDRQLGVGSRSPAPLSKFLNSGTTMALLIVDLDKYIGNAKAWCDTFEEKIPDLEIRIWPDAGNLREIEYLAFMRPN